MLYENNLPLRKRVAKISNTKSIEVAECATVFMVTNATGGAYIVSLPSAANAGAGWNCSFIVAQAASMDNTVEIKSGDGADSMAVVMSHGATAADGESNILAQSIKFAAASKRGARIEVFTDGAKWYANAEGGAVATFSAHE